MDRVFEQYAVQTAPNAPAVPSIGYPTAGNPSSGIPATQPGEYWYYMITEALRNIVTGSGLTPDHTALDQVLKAIQIFAGGNVTTITADEALTAAEAGLVLIDATAGNVTVTLPAADTLAALGYTLVRVDTSANTVTIAPNGADTVDGAASLTLAPGARRRIKADGVSDWVHASPRKASAAALLAGTDDESFATPAGLLAGFLGAGSIATNGYAIIPVRDAGSGVRSELILQMGSVSWTRSASGTYIHVSATFPIAFPNNLLGVVATLAGQGNAGSYEKISAENRTINGFDVVWAGGSTAADAGTGMANFFAWGN